MGIHNLKTKVDSHTLALPKVFHIDYNHVAYPKQLYQSVRKTHTFNTTIAY